MKTMEHAKLLRDLRLVYDTWPKQNLPIETEYGSFILTVEDSAKESIMAGIEALIILRHAVPILRLLANDNGNLGVSFWASSVLQELPFYLEEKS
jgi:hypothetical protein